MDAVVTYQYQLLPDLSTDEYSSLKADIARRGVMVPVEYDEDGHILDGHHRVKICQELGLRDWPRIVRVGMTEEQKTEHVLAINLDRRHLTREQRQELVGRLRAQGWSTRRIAEKLKTSDATVRRDLGGATFVAPEIVTGTDGKQYPAQRAEPEPEPIKTATLFNPSLSDMSKLAKMDADTKTAVAEKIASGVADTLPRAIQAVAKERAPESAVTPPLPTGKYRCIVIDPPWPMQKIEREERPQQGETLDYPVMSLAEIEALPVAELADEAGCHVYLWVTQKYLPEGLRLFEAWGVKYQCLLTWVKPTGMTPYSWMYNTEHVLFGRIGSLQLDRLGLKLAFEAPVIKHSQKPDVFYERVVQASPGPRIDMFARHTHNGFTAWGNEI